MMEIDKYNWDTTHETANDTMTVSFEFRRLTFVANFKTGKGIVFKGDEIAKEYILAELKGDKILEEFIRLAKDDARLAQFEQPKK